MPKNCVFVCPSSHVISIVYLWKGVGCWMGDGVGGKGSEGQKSYIRESE